mmetsp:Transcript_29128/g.90774  ORF Transcript_29128/g.90774 Transcript_29128/m.90774 type:complete len:203 (+) Transcript_29128:342-950(+)
MLSAASTCKAWKSSARRSTPLASPWCGCPSPTRCSGATRGPGASTSGGTRSSPGSRPWRCSTRSSAAWAATPWRLSSTTTPRTASGAAGPTGTGYGSTPATSSTLRTAGSRTGACWLPATGSAGMSWATTFGTRCASPPGLSAGPAGAPARWPAAWAAAAGRAPRRPAASGCWRAAPTRCSSWRGSSGRSGGCRSTRTALGH